jgi:hypothetical protein
MSAREFLSLPRLVHIIALSLFDEKTANQIFDYLMNGSHIVFSLPDSIPYTQNAASADYEIVEVKDRQTYARLKRIYHLIQYALYNTNISVVVTHYEDYPSDDPQHMLSNEKSQLYLRDFFINKGKISRLSGSPTISFSYDILNFVLPHEEETDMPRNKITADIKLVKAWIKNNNFIVGEFKPFYNDCICHVFSKEFPRDKAVSIWTYLKGD